MRLIDTHTGRVIDRDSSAVAYAILSHTWDRTGEKTLQGVKEIQESYGPDSSPVGTMRRMLRRSDNLTRGVFHCWEAL